MGYRYKYIYFFFLLRKGALQIPMPADCSPRGSEEKKPTLSSVLRTSHSDEETRTISVSCWWFVDVLETRRDKFDIKPYIYIRITYIYK